MRSDRCAFRCEQVRKCNRAWCATVEGVRNLGESDSGSDSEWTGRVVWEVRRRLLGRWFSRVVLRGSHGRIGAYYYCWFYMVTVVVRIVVLCMCKDPEPAGERREGEHVREIVRYLGAEPSEFDELVCVVELQGEFLEVRCPLPFHGDLRHLVQRQRRPSCVHHSSLRA